MKELSIIVPVLNESKILNNFIIELKELQGDYEVIFSDSGSIDESKEILRNENVIYNKFKTPSVGLALLEGAKVANGKYLLFLPCDCMLSQQSLDKLSLTLKQDIDGGAFFKVYDKSSYLLKLYEGIQNIIRLKLLNHSVWTNGIFIHNKWKSEISTIGFLEDVYLSDKLRNKNIRIIETPIVVSSRRYYPNRVVKRILVNVFVMFLFRARIIKDINKLKELYLIFK